MAASVGHRLLGLAHERRRDYRLVLHSYAVERLLYRLSRSRHQERFLLRGRVLLAAWLGDTTRASSHLELLGREQVERAVLLEVFREILSSVDDAIVFDVGTLRAEATESNATCTRIDVEATLEKVRIPASVEIGYGDVVFPTPGGIKYPTLLNEPCPRLRCYRRETAVAELLQQIVTSRSKPPPLSAMRDLHLLIRMFDFEGPAMARATHTTFRRRATAVPEIAPPTLTVSPARLRAVQAQWRVLRATDPLLKDTELADCLSLIAGFAGPVFKAMASAEVLISWQAGKGWKPTRAASHRSGRSASSRP
jgi:hypothetical protein